MSDKAISIRIPEETRHELEAIARVEDVSISEAIRAAIHCYIATRRSSQAFKERLRKRLEEDRKFLEQLSSEIGGNGKGS